MAIFVAIASILSIPALATDTAKLGAYPTTPDPTNPLTKSWFVYSLAPGQQKQDSVTVVNHLNQPLTVKVYPVDATTTSDGVFALRNETDARADVGAWVKMDTKQITLAANDRQQIPFTITIPSNATVGDHAGGIVFEEAAVAQPTTTGNRVNIVSRVGVRIYETVPGDKQILAGITDFSQGQQQGQLQFQFGIENKGNVFIQPTAQIDVTDWLGHSADQIKIDTLGTVVPGRPVHSQATSTLHVPVLGHYSATLQVNYGTGRSVSRQLSFWLVDWPLLGGMLAAVMVLLVVVVWLVRRHHHLIMDTEEASIPEPGGESRWAALANKVKVKRTARQQLDANPPSENTEYVRTEDVDQIFVARHIKFAVGFLLVLVVLASAVFAWFMNEYSISVTKRLAVSAQTTVAPLTQAVQITPSASSSATQASASVTPTPSPTVDKASVIVTVLNGGAKAGEAGRIAQLLRAGGFGIGLVGNAATIPSQTTLQFPVGQETAAGLIAAAIKDSYPNVQLVAQGSIFTLTLTKQ